MVGMVNYYFVLFPFFSKLNGLTTPSKFPIAQRQAASQEPNSDEDFVTLEPR
jgi:hypothetical protein